MTLTLRCEGLYKAFGGVTALLDVSLDLACGSVTAIIGPNGAGKTTLFNVVTGFLEPDSGRCSLDDNELVGLKPFQIAQLGIVRTFQSIRLVRQVSVLDNLMLARPKQKGEKLGGLLLSRARLKSEEKVNVDRCMAILAFLGLSAKVAELAGSLSFGEQKLLSIGCCLATEANFLLLDEPLAGIHPALGEKILIAIQKLAIDGRGLVFIEHDVDSVRIAAERVIVMSGGRVIASGSPADVLERPDVAEVYLV